MKKSALIKLLQGIKGDPEIKLWNGFVDDWVDISPKVEQVNLVRLSQQYWIECIRREQCIDLNDASYQLPAEQVENLMKNYGTICKWELDQFFSRKDVDENRYQVKSV